MTILFLTACAVVSLGVIWYWIVVPIYESVVSTIPPTPTPDYVTTPERVAAAPPAVVQGQDGQDEPDSAPPPTYTREQLLTLYALLRAHKVSRETARPVLKALGIPLSNDLWSAAAPLPADERPRLTPIAKRPTSAAFADDLEFEAPPR